MLELRNVCVATNDSGGGEIEIINDVSLNLGEKKIYVVTGPNGGGKTSLAKAVMGIYPVSEGAILLDGEDITEKTITERAKMGIGYAFQAPTRFKGLKVRDFLTIAAGGGAMGAAGPADSGATGGVTADGGTVGGVTEHRLYSLLVDVGLCAQDYIDRELNSGFSGGELKRIEIASVLARNLRVALFDEPEAGIDLWSFQRLCDTFRRLNELSGAAIVIISHQERILRLADEVIIVAGGKVTGISTPEEFLEGIDLGDPECSFCPNCSEIYA